MNNSARSTADIVAQTEQNHIKFIDLQFTDINTPGAQVPVSVSNVIGSDSRRTTFVAASMTNFLDTVAYGLAGFSVSNAPGVGDYLQLTTTKTNGTLVVVTVTNSPGNTNTGPLVQQLLIAVNNNGALQAADGLVAALRRCALPAGGPGRHDSGGDEILLGFRGNPHRAEGASVSRRAETGGGFHFRRHRPAAFCRRPRRANPFVVWPQLTRAVGAGRQAASDADGKPMLLRPWCERLSNHQFLPRRHHARTGSGLPANHFEIHAPDAAALKC